MSSFNLDADAAAIGVGVSSDVATVPTSTVALIRWAYTLGRTLGADEPRGNSDLAIALERSAARSDDAAASAVLDAMKFLLRGFDEGREAARETLEYADEATTAEHRVLELLQRLDRPVRPRDISTSVDLSAAYTTRLLAKLLEEKLVERLKPTSLDKRAVAYAIAEPGLEVLVRARRLGMHGDAPSALEIAEAQARTARALIDGAKDDRRRGLSDLVDTQDVVERVIEAATEVNDDYLVVDAVAELATTLRHHLKYKDAQTAFDAPEFVHVLSGDSKKVRYAKAVRAYEQAKVQMARRKNLDDAMSTFRGVRDTLLDADYARPVPLLTWTEVAASECSRFSGDLFQSLRYAHLAFKSSQVLPDPFAFSKSAMQLVFIHRLLGQHQAAKGVLADLIPVTRESKLLRLESECALHHGEVIRYQDKPAEAWDHLKFAVDGLRQADAGKKPRRGLAFGISAQGACAYDRGLMDLAETLFEEALRVGEAAGATDAIALTQRRFGVLLLETKRVEEGERRIRIAKRAYSHGATASPVGQVECGANLFAKAPGPTAFRPMQTQLEKLVGSKLAVDAAELKETEEPARLLDRWVREKVVNEAGQEIADKFTGEWQTLLKDGLAAHHALGAGNSVMGKEPVLVPV